MGAAPVKQRICLKSKKDREPHLEHEVQQFVDKWIPETLTPEQQKLFFDRLQLETAKILLAATKELVPQWFSIRSRHPDKICKMKLVLFTRKHPEGMRVCVAVNTQSPRSYALRVHSPVVPWVT